MAVSTAAVARQLAPPYAPSEPEQKRSAVMSYLQFLVGFLGMLAIIYALLLLTTWIVFFEQRRCRADHLLKKPLP